MATIPSVTTQTVGGTGAAAWANSVKAGIDFLVGTSAGARPIVSLRQTVAQNFTTSSWTAVTFTTEDVDSDATHSTTTNTSRVTAVTAGWYQFSGMCSLAGSASGVRQIGLRKNGSTTDPPTDGNHLAIGNSGGDVLHIGASLIYLAVGDYVELMFRQNSGGALATVVATTEFQPRFQALWVRTA